MPISLITSASFIDNELAAEFGKLPPSFLPFGHNRLYDLQVEIFGPGAFLTLPAGYTIPEADQVRLAKKNVTVIPVPEGLSLAHSVSFALEVIGETPALRILHGDTVIYDLPAGLDVLATSDRPEAYDWGAVEGNLHEGAAGHVLAGYFAFADGIEFRRQLAKSEGNFVKAVARYGEQRPLRHHEVGTWLDCGHLQTYYRSRCSMRTQRSFNDLAISFQVVEKRSQNQTKLDNEAAWFNNLPAPLRLYTPAFLGHTGPKQTPGYALEYLASPTLHELFVFGDVSEGVWRKILGSSFKFLHEAQEIGKSQVNRPAIKQLTVDKTEDRLNTFLKGYDICPRQEWRYKGCPLPSLHQIAAHAATLIDMDSMKTLGIMHGDMCFTNMFYDFRTQRIKLIDPRGSVDGTNPTVLGDSRYDMAKLNHSVVGAYDFILAGRHRTSGFETYDCAIEFPEDSSFKRVNALTGEFSLQGLRLDDPEVTAISLHLFLSMLPLHADRPDRQRAFVANSLRLFAERIDR